MAKKVRTERQCTNLKTEIDEIVCLLYGTDNKDIDVRYYNLKTYRAEIFRSFILHMHLAIEELLRALLFDFMVRQNRQLKSKETIRTLNDLRSAEIVHWCGRLRLVTPKQYDELLELNRIRNKCAHHWLLDIPKYKVIRFGNNKKRVTIPVVTYKGKNVMTRDVFVRSFTRTVGNVYLKLLFRVWKIQDDSRRQVRAPEP
jgi:hypothetical protein